MRWVNGETWGAEIHRRGQWHPWFAWHPVTVAVTTEGNKIKVWLAWVERRQDLKPMWEWLNSGSIWCPEYREIGAGGFTLIELLICLAIIGILAAIAIPEGIKFMARVQALRGLW